MLVIVRPQRAAVRPRVVPIRTSSGVPVLLEELVAHWLDARAVGVVTLSGGPGSGKSTALAHVAALFAHADSIALLDDSDPSAFDRIDRSRLSICVTERSFAHAALAQLRLAPWGEDEWIEFLLAAHREQCASVVRRLRVSADAAMLRGVAELCCTVLDRMASDESIAGAQSALDRHAEELVHPADRRSAIEALCLRRCFAKDPEAIALATRALEETSGDAYRFIRHRLVRSSLAARALIDELTARTLDPRSLRALAPDLQDRAAKLLLHEPRAVERLHRWLATGKGAAGAGIASLLHAADPVDLARWLAASAKRRRALALDGARLRGAPWSGLKLRYIRLAGADLSRADLRGADAKNAFAERANFADADLREADLDGLHADSALFSGARLDGCRAHSAKFSGASFQAAQLRGARMALADFSGADLRDANFAGAELSRARFTIARLDGASFRDARLEHADLCALDLRRCDLAGATLSSADLGACVLEGANLDGLDFNGAYLEQAHLTGASLRGAKLARAKLRGAHLADVDGEGADLRDADLSRASFHMGSSRSGLVFHAMPMEGSRTGFYTDDYFDNSYKRPEEVRKANLRRADLRGANVEGTDFYLVDLREALYTEEQAEHFRKCNAILATR